MKNNSTIILLILLIWCQPALPQNTAIQLSIIPVFGNNKFDLAAVDFMSNDSHQVQVSELKFYLSDLQFFKAGKLVLQEKNSFHLIDASKLNTLQVVIANDSNVAVDELKFNLGVDSATNVSGALGGDLDPTKGMYWAWQSGYINFKLEGRSNQSSAKNQAFEFHLGGYEKDNYCLQKLQFSLVNTNRVNLKLDVQQILQEIDVSKTNRILSPCPEAVMLSKIVANSFRKE